MDIFKELTPFIPLAIPLAGAFITGLFQNQQAKTQQWAREQKVRDEYFNIYEALKKIEAIYWKNGSVQSNTWE